MCLETNDKIAIKGLHLDGRNQPLLAKSLPNMNHEYRHCSIKTGFMVTKRHGQDHYYPWLTKTSQYKKISWLLAKK